MPLTSPPTSTPCPEARGLKAIAEGFGLIHADDHAILSAEFPVYDALYAWCAARTDSSSG